MADVAALGLGVDSEGLVTGGKRLDDFAAKSEKAGKSADRLGQANSRSMAAIESMARQLDKITAILSSIDKATTSSAAALAQQSAAATQAERVNATLATTTTRLTLSYSQMAPAATQAAAAVSSQAAAASSTSSSMAKLDAHVLAYQNHLTGMALATNGAVKELQQLDAHVLAYQAHLAAMPRAAAPFDAHIVAYRQNLDNVRSSLKFTGIEGLNFSRQLADIGVTAASGMNPLMIALQQGPQLFDILQNKAVMTGATIGTVARAAGAQIYAAVAPLLPVLAAVAAAAAAIGAGFALGAREINKGNSDLSKGLGLTEKQLERVKKSGVDTAVTMGDTFFAFFDVVGDRLTSAFDGPLKWLSEAWNATLDFIVEYGGTAIKFVIGAFTGAVSAIRASWQLLPKALGDIFYSIANVSLKALEGFINAWVDGINWVIKWANDTLGTGFTELGKVSLGQLTNEFAGGAKEFTDAFAQGMREGYDAAGGAIDRFWADVGKRARERREQAIRDAAGAAEKGSKGPKSEAAKFADLVGATTRDIAMIEAETKALGMAEDAAMLLTNQQKLLNDAQSKGITLTDAQRGVLMGLAKDLTDAQIALRNAKVFQEIKDEALEFGRTIDQGVARVGLYGKSLNELTYYQELLNKATNNGKREIDEETDKRLRQIAALKAEGQARLDLATFIEAGRKAHADAITSLQREAGELGLTGAELYAYRKETELLAAARQANLDKDPAVREAIKQQAQEYGELADRIARAAENLAALNGGMSSMRGPLGQVFGALTSNNPTAALLGMGGVGTLAGLFTTGGRDAYQKQGEILAKNISKEFGVSSQFSKTLSSALQGASTGTLAGSIIGKSQANQIGGAIGGAAGKALGSAIAGPIGGMIGSVLGGIAGSALGGLFKKDKYGTTTIVGGEGYGTSGNSQKNQTGANSLADNFQSVLNNIAKTFGTTLGNFAVSIGVTNGKINVNPGQVTGMIGTTKQRDTIDFGEDQAAALKYAIKNAIEDGALSGLSEGWKKFLLNSNDIEGQLSKLAGLKSAYDELSSLKDPQGYALEQLSKAFDELRATATAAGDDLAKVEELYGLKRKEIVEKYASESRDLEIEILQLQGKAEEALALSRQAELDAADASIRPLMERRNALLDEATAAQAAAAALAEKNAADNRVLALQQRYSRAIGDDATAKALERMQELTDAQTEQERSMLRSIYAAEDLVDAQSKAADSMSTFASMIQSVADAAYKASAELRTYANQIFDEATQTDPTVLLSQIQAAMKAGNAAVLPDLIKAYLPMAENQSGSLAEYQKQVAYLRQGSLYTADLADAQANQSANAMSWYLRQMQETGGSGSWMSSMPEGFYADQANLGAISAKQADRIIELLERANSDRMTIGADQIVEMQTQTGTIDDAFNGGAGVVILEPTA